MTNETISKELIDLVDDEFSIDMRILVSCKGKVLQIYKCEIIEFVFEE